MCFLQFSNKNFSTRIVSKEDSNILDLTQTSERERSLDWSCQRTFAKFHTLVQLQIIFVANDQFSYT